MVWYSQLLKNYPQFVVIHKVKGFGVVSKAKVDVFLELSCFFYDPVDVGSLITGYSPFSKSSLDIWKFFVHLMLKPSIQSFKYDITGMGDECICLMVSTFFSTILLGNWNEE